MRISLVVIRCKDIDQSKRFYERLGMDFVKEQHGNSPVHYSTTVDGTTLELYPNNGVAPNDNVRLGFIVKRLEAVVKPFAIVGSYNQGIGKVYVINDPDGRKVELSE